MTPELNKFIPPKESELVSKVDTPETFVNEIAESIEPIAIENDIELKPENNEQIAVETEIKKESLSSIVAKKIKAIYEEYGVKGVDTVKDFFKKTPLEIMQTIGTKEELAKFEILENRLAETKKQEELRTLNIIKIEDIGINSLNQVYIVTLENGNKAVIKPVSGEKTNTAHIEGITRTEAGDFYRREQMAFEIAKTIGVNDIFPATIIREIELNGESQLCSVQEFIQTDGNYVDALLDENNMLSSKQLAQYRKSMSKTQLADLILWNVDRHSGNFLFKRDDKSNIAHVVPIDHGLIGTKQMPHHTMKSYEENNILLLSNIDKLTQEYIINIANSIEDQTILKEKLQNILNSKVTDIVKKEQNSAEIDAIIWRIKTIGETIEKQQNIDPANVTYSETYRNLNYVVPREVLNLHENCNERSYNSNLYAQWEKEPDNNKKAAALKNITTKSKELDEKFESIFNAANREELRRLQPTN